jgi:hypothetical protein
MGENAAVIVSIRPNDPADTPYNCPSYSTMSVYTVPSAKVVNPGRAIMLPELSTITFSAEDSAPAGSNVAGKVLFIPLNAPNDWYTSAIIATL